MCKINTRDISRPRARKRVKVGGNWAEDEAELKNEVKKSQFLSFYSVVDIPAYICFGLLEASRFHQAYDDQQDE